MPDDSPRDDRTLRQKLEAMAAQSDVSPWEAKLAAAALERLDSEGRVGARRCALGAPRRKVSALDFLMSGSTITFVGVPNTEQAQDDFDEALRKIRELFERRD
jgi:hypothetical protein